jgi:hypothetical protein
VYVGLWAVAARSAIAAIPLDMELRLETRSRNMLRKPSLNDLDLDLPKVLLLVGVL